MKRGFRYVLLLFAVAVLYTTALGAAGMMVSIPPDQTVCTMSRQESGKVTFPADVAGTPLRALRTVRYEGAFLENGGDTPIVDGLGLLVENTGEHHIRSAWVMLTGAGETFFFLARDLPPFSRTVLLEIGGAFGNITSFDFITGNAETVEEPDLLARGDIEIVPVDLGSVTVTNRTEQTIGTLELTYKNYLEGADRYQGGICYRCRIYQLRPGQTVTLRPAHYAAGYSRFVYAETVPNEEETEQTEIPLT